ncbi:lactonase family protein [Olivibacter sp. XZL3]|uniref:lactonase family protein n=1 Tax=Olivibacter sp. XZL3 TaxID=1735116 RepID=UPI001064A92A|nr:lactonase family protein [Olivibacter sp. XZL3]
MYCTILLPMVSNAQSKTINVLIGTYTNTGKSKGIYVYAFDPNTGRLSLKNEIESANPSFLALSSDKKFVYAVNELEKGEGTISAFQYKRADGKLSLLNTQLTHGDSPCHVTVDANTRYAVASNYSGGSFTVFGIQPDGRLSEKVQLVKHEGSGPDKSRQEGPHVHSATFSPDGKFLLVQDLGTDRITIYRYDASDNKQPVALTAVNEAKASPGSGPRHLTFSKDGKYVYLVQEMKAAITVYSYKDGHLTPIQEVSMLNPSFGGEVGAADVHISPDGKFLYASNRGEANDIAIYSINAATGEISHIGNESVKGKGPRNFAIAPDGKFLLVANQYTDEVIVFARNEETGRLTDTGNRIDVGAPVCVLFDE